MKIGMIGAGAVARSVALSALRQGHQVALSSRRGTPPLADVVRDLGEGASAVPVAEAASADLVLLAVPWLQVEAALTGLPPWNGRILVDATNPFVATTPELVLADLGDTGASEIVARLAPGSRLVKAFNSIRMVHYDAGPWVGAARRVLFVSGDDRNAKSQVASLIESFGFAAIDLGGLVAGGRLQQAGGPLAGRDLLLAT
jgi:8-hydroxy-5-deazaflavin:NADPH oxidoreductase